jgi:hypothetical protein
MALPIAQTLYRINFLLLRNVMGNENLLLYSAAETERDPTLLAFLEEHATRIAWQYGYPSRTNVTAYIPQAMHID